MSRCRFFPLWYEGLGVVEEGYMSIRRKYRLGRSVFILIAFVVGAAAVTPAIAELPPLIPRETLFGNPDKAQARISPDGKMLTWLRMKKGC